MVSKLFDLLLFLPARNKSFSQSVKSTNFFPVQAFLHNQVIFPESRDFSTVKEFFYIHGIFQESRNFLAIKEFVRNQGILPQSWKFSTIMEFFHSQRNFPQKKYTNKKVFHEIFFLRLSSFPQTKLFTQSKKIFSNKDQKAYLKAKVLDTFNTKLCAEIFSPFNAYW